jgi:hypothetical protein
VPAALLAVGLALAYRERYGLAGIVLGVGAALKWTPALAALALLVWLLASRRAREGVRHAAGFVVAFGALTIPYLAWDADDSRRVRHPGWADDHRRVAALPAAALARPGGARGGLLARRRRPRLGGSGGNGRPAAPARRRARGCVARARAPCGRSSRGRGRPVAFLLTNRIFSSHSSSC